MLCNGQLYNHRNSNLNRTYITITRTWIYMSVDEYKRLLSACRFNITWKCGDGHFRNGTTHLFV